MKDKRDGKGPSENTIKLIGNGLEYFVNMEKKLMK
jgi:hypothetical protein